MKNKIGDFFKINFLLLWMDIINIKWSIENHAKKFKKHKNTESSSINSNNRIFDFKNFSGLKYIRYPSLVNQNDELYFLYYAFNQGWRIFLNKNLNQNYCITFPKGYQNYKGPAAIFYNDWVYSLLLHSKIGGITTIVDIFLLPFLLYSPNIAVIGLEQI